MCLQAAAAVLQAYPPRGALNLQLMVDKQPVTSLLSGIDRFVVQDYVIDTIHYFDGDNNELARRLGIGMASIDAVYYKIISSTPVAGLRAMCVRCQSPA